jgi:type IV pilus assembly protein PilA
VITKLRKKAEEGFTLIELMIVVAIIGILAAVAIPAFMKYIKKSKTTEARQFVKKIYEGAREYYMDRGGQRGSVQPLAAQFPSPSQGPTPTLGTCCASGDKCAPSAALWTHAVWVALKFSVDDPSYFMYTYNHPNATQYTARANGDLDCDGEYSTFEMFGEINSVYADGPAGSASLYRENDLE